MTVAGFLIVMSLFMLACVLLVALSQWQQSEG
jgi:hypothetical protein